MVTSVGWNPFFDNKTKTVEPHLLHEFPADFYGSEIRIIITGMSLRVRACMHVCMRACMCACMHARARAPQTWARARARALQREREKRERERTTRRISEYS